MALYKFTYLLTSLRETPSSSFDSEIQSYQCRHYKETSLNPRMDHFQMRKVQSFDITTYRKIPSFVSGVKLSIKGSLYKTVVFFLKPT